MLRPRHRQGAVDVDGRRHVDRRGHSTGVLDAQTDEASAVGPGGGIGGRAHTRRSSRGVARERAGSGQCGHVGGRLAARTTGGDAAEVQQHHGAQEHRGQPSDRRDRDLAALAHGVRAVAVTSSGWPASVTGTLTRTSWPRTSTSAPRVTDGGKGPPLGHQHGHLVGDPLGAGARLPHLEEGHRPHGQEPGQARREHKLDCRLPARIHWRTTGADDEISRREAGHDAGHPEGDHHAPVGLRRRRAGRIEGWERRQRRAGRRPADHRRPRAGPRRRLGSRQGPAGQRRLPDAARTSTSAGASDDDLDAGLRALAIVRPVTCAHRRPGPRHATRRERLRERHKSAATIGAG